MRHLSEKPQVAYMLPLIVEPKELAKHLDEVVIFDLSREETYAQVHLPGAIHIHPAQTVRGEKPAVGKLPYYSQGGYP